MELSEAVLVSLISTAMILVAHMLRTKYRRGIRVYGPFAYRLKESDTLTEIPAGSIPSKLVDTLREERLNRFKRPETIMLRKSALAIFALIVFLVQLMIFLTIIK